jgi:hypothetical protein
MNQEKLDALNAALQRNHDAIFQVIQEMVLMQHPLPVFPENFPEPEAQAILLEVANNHWADIEMELSYDGDGNAERINNIKFPA